MPGLLIIFIHKFHYVALDAIQFALKKKIKINKDLSFVSFANLSISSYSAYPPLASVEQYPYIQGEKATGILMELMNKNNQEPRQNDAFYKVIVESQLVLHD